MNEALENWRPYIHTINAANGKEFTGRELVAKHLNINYYFTRPYLLWERGSNENLNGLIRQYFPKGSDFTLISHNTINLSKINLIYSTHLGFREIGEFIFFFI